jgi:hypothetical protein
VAFSLAFDFGCIRSGVRSTSVAMGNRSRQRRRNWLVRSVRAPTQ